MRCHLPDRVGHDSLKVRAGETAQQPAIAGAFRDQQALCGHSIAFGLDQHCAHPTGNIFLTGHRGSPCRRFNGAVTLSRFD